MYCTSCGNQMMQGAEFCPSCGVKTSNKVEKAFNVEDRSSFGFNLLSFFIPIVGLILYFGFKEKTPIKAKGVLTWGIIGFVVNIILLI